MGFNGIFFQLWINGQVKFEIINSILRFSDGSDSYVEFIYPEGGIEWVRGVIGNGEGGLPDARAQAGLARPPYMHTLPHSGTDKVHLLTK